MKKVIGILIAMILVFAIGGAGYFYIAPLFANSEEEADENKIYVQNVDEIVNGFSFTSNRYSGVVETQELVKVDSDSDKKIKTTYVKEGDAVKTGDKLFEYDIDDMKIQLDENKLGIAQAENNIKDYNAQIDALEKEKKTLSVNKQLSITNQIEGLKLDVKKAEYSKESLEKSNKKLEIAVKNAVVKSTTNGTVKTVNDPTTDSYITIASDGDFRIKAMVSELNVTDFIEGEDMIIRSRIDEDMIWTGKVTSVDTAKPTTENSMYSGETTTKYPVYISIDNTDGLLIGQHVTVEENMGEELNPGLWLDEGYILDADSNPYVWKDSKNATIEKCYVELGEYDEDLGKYEITSGLTEDDFIAYPEDRVTEGMETTYNASAGISGGSDEVTSGLEDFATGNGYDPGIAADGESGDNEAFVEDEE